MCRKVVFVVFFLLPLSVFSYTPPDSCLKVIWHGYIGDSIFVDQTSGKANPYFAKCDSCYGSPTFGKWWIKKYFQIEMIPNHYPLNVMVNRRKITATVNDIKSDSTFEKFKNGMLKISNDFGNFMFRTRLDLDSSFLKERPILYLEFEDYQPMDYLYSEVKKLDLVWHVDLIHNVYDYGMGISFNKHFNENSDILVNNFVFDNLNVKRDYLSNNFMIVGVDGQIVKSGIIEQSINLSNLTIGKYYFIIEQKNIFQPFIKTERR